jgi:hypothetical protein
MEEAEEAQVARSRPVKRLVALALFLILLLVLAVLWSQRNPIAADYLDREFARRGVQAKYDVKRIGFRTQRLENLVIGDPRRPDLTARWVEVRLGWALFTRPKVTLITARGVRLFGRVVDGRVRLGQVDKLLPPPSGLPFRFPDQNIDVADASIRLDTPAGRLGLAVEGKGNLADGFRGKMAAVSSLLQVGDCSIASSRAYFQVAIEDLRPSFDGPLRAASIGCGRGFLLRAPLIGLNATLAPGLDRWRGRARVEAAGARFGDASMARLSGSLSFLGNADDTRGSLDVAAGQARLARFNARRTAVEGRYALGPRSGRFALSGAASARSVNVAPATAPIAEALAATGPTPVGPIGKLLSAALARASSSIDVAASLNLTNGPGGGAVRAERLSAASRSGARLKLAGGEGLTYRWPRGAARIDGTLSLEGGGFPSTRFSLRQPRAGGAVTGVGRIAAMAAGSARLALGEIRFTAAPGGATRIDTVADLGGPFNDGRVDGLVVPVSGRFGGGGFVLGETCTQVRFRALKAGGLLLGPTSLPLCPTGRALVWRSAGGVLSGGAQVRAPRLSGRLGQSPIRFASDRVRFSLADPGFTSADVAVRLLGREGAVNRFEAASLAGRFNRYGVIGTFSGFSGKLAAVPLLYSEGQGRWQVQRGKVLAQGRLKIADVNAPPRFYPLVSNDVTLTLIDNIIKASGWLNDPETGTRVARADVDHSLRSGVGRAVLDVPGITFDEKYQPEELTRLTTGVIALVKGTIRGRGEIEWDGRGTRSTGAFTTDDMDFAATFGPVEGLATTIRFTDLLGLATAPGQRADVKLIRTGIDVLDGQIRYQLLPGLQVRVEEGRWPFAGGELRLEETLLDFSKPTAKRLTFRLTGVDAARFVQQMEFANISATGTFDGVVPMVFDERGGRIEGGRIAAREEGGTLSYIGELTDKQLGVYGKLAFDALKALRYSKLVIGLDGSLQGEFLADIELDGVARDTGSLPRLAGGSIRNMIVRRGLRQLSKIPFEFNIKVRGPFRTLLATTRSFEDPTNLIQSVLPDLLRNQQTTTTTVQQTESEKVR